MTSRQESLFGSRRLQMTESIKLTIDSLYAYGPTHKHWAIAWSGGKDSTTLLTLVVHLIETGKVPKPETLTVLYADTRMELLPLWIAAQEILVELGERGIETRIVMAPMDKRFLVYILGRGVPPPNNNTLRWCTRQIKIEPMADELRRLHGARGEKILMLTGVRQATGADGSRWVYHSKVTIWKCPVTEMQRTKSHGLLYKTLRADASYSRQGCPDYLVLFRKWHPAQASAEPVKHTVDELPLDLWQRYASPVWMDIDQTDVLNAEVARTDKDEKHICPLQLGVIERCVHLWSNPGDRVFSPFAGIGSEGFVSLKQGRKFTGIELKPEYFERARRNLVAATAQLDLFGGAREVRAP